MGAAYVELGLRLDERFGPGVCYAGPPWPRTFGDLWNEARHFRDSKKGTGSGYDVTRLNDDEIWDVICEVVNEIARPLKIDITKELPLADVLSPY